MKIALTILVTVILFLSLTPVGRDFVGYESMVTTPTTVETGNYAQELAAADNVLRATLFDYGSARIDWDLALINGALTVRVNAKNQFGGYVGFKTYTFRHGVIQ